MTKIDQQWAQGIRDNVNALISEVERLESIVEAKDRLLAEQAAVIERAEKALQPFDLAHCSALAGDNPMRDITLHDLRFASETYHVLPDTQEKPK